MDEKEYDLTIFSVATDRYISYWSAMVNSFLKTNGSTFRIQWVVFTDNFEKIDPELIKVLGSSLYRIKIQHKPWPYPTLMRYHFYEENKNIFAGRIIMHLDADMQFVNNLNLTEMESSLGKAGITLVEHPGYYRPKGYERITFYLRNPKYILKDTFTYAKNCGLGTWENNQESKAYLSIGKRNLYVCGGTWFGYKKQITDLCGELSDRINLDLKNNIIAKYHDESHLNWYRANHLVNVIKPELCFEPTYPQLKKIKPKIIAINKNNEKVWVR